MFDRTDADDAATTLNHFEALADALGVSPARVNVVLTDDEGTPASDPITHDTLTDATTSYTCVLCEEDFNDEDALRSHFEDTDDVRHVCMDVDKAVSHATDDEDTDDEDTDDEDTDDYKAFGEGQEPSLARENGDTDDEDDEDDAGDDAGTPDEDDAVTCPAPDCDTTGSFHSVRSHFGGKGDDAHTLANYDEDTLAEIVDDAPTTDDEGDDATDTDDEDDATDDATDDEGTHVTPEVDDATAFDVSEVDTVFTKGATVPVNDKIRKAVRTNDTYEATKGWDARRRGVAFILAYGYCGHPECDWGTNADNPTCPDHKGYTEGYDPHNPATDDEDTTDTTDTDDEGDDALKAEVMATARTLYENEDDMTLQEAKAEAKEFAADL